MEGSFWIEKEDQYGLPVAKILGASAA